MVNNAWVCQNIVDNKKKYVNSFNGRRRKLRAQTGKEALRTSSAQDLKDCLFLCEFLNTAFQDMNTGILHTAISSSSFKPRELNS